MQKKSSTIIIFLLLIITGILFTILSFKKMIKNDVKTGNVTKKTTNKPSVITTNQEIDKLTREEVVGAV